MSIGDIQAFIQYSRQFTQPLTQLASMINVMQSGIASAERVFELLDAEEEIRGRRDPARGPRARRAASSSTTSSFSYDPENPLIEDLSLVAEPGETVAIVGPDRRRQDDAREPHHAVLRRSTTARSPLDGIDISKMRRRDLRSNMGMVLQDTWLFGGTIRENIAFGNLDATEEQILAAARGHVRRPVRALAPARLRHGDRRRRRHRERGREAAAHDRARVPRRTRRS